MLVIHPTALPAGTLDNFQTFTPERCRRSGRPGNRSTRTCCARPRPPAEFSIVFDSGPLTVPAEADGVHTWPVPADGRRSRAT